MQIPISRRDGTVAETKNESDLIVNGAVVTVPAGHYKEEVSKSIATATQATPSISIDSTGKITASATQTAGYVAAGTKSATKQMTVQTAKTVTPSTSEQTAVASGVYTTGVITVAAMPTVTQATPSISIDSAGKITASATQTAGYVAAGTKTGTKQLTVQAAKTVTPSTSEQTAVASGVYTTGTVKVAAMPTATQATPSISVDSAGKITASATQTAGYVAAGTKSATKQLSIKAATTITPTTSNQTAVAKNVYTTGVITVKGDSNLKAANIKQGVTIFGVAGTCEPAPDRSLLYDSGNTYSNVTGGWVGVTDSQGSCTLGTSAITLSYTGTGSTRKAACYTVNKIDLTDFQTLHVSVNATAISTASSAHGIFFGVSSYKTSEEPSVDDHFKTYTKIPNLGTAVVSLDVSALSGSYYVCVAILASSVDVYKVWGE